MARFDEVVQLFPKVRPALRPEYEKIYVEQYLANRKGYGLEQGLVQKMEAWMHRQIARESGGPILELGAGTLNHRRYEAEGAVYDVVEPFRDLYASSPEARQVRNFWDTLAEVTEEYKYKRIISIAVLEHVENLPALIAKAALHLEPNGSFQAAIPCEGGVAWGLAWRCVTGPMFKWRTGLSYKTLMRHEHINRYTEMVTLLKGFFEHVEVTAFPLPWWRVSFYASIKATLPRIELCKKFVA